MKLKFSPGIGIYITSDALEDVLRDFINTGCPNAIDLAMEYLSVISGSESGDLDERKES